MRMRWILILAAVAVLLPGCDVDDAQPSSAGTATFQWCRHGPRGGGYHIRALGIPCRRVARILPHLYISSTAERIAHRRERDPDAGNRRLWEDVYRTEAGWTCLVQSLPGL